MSATASAKAKSIIDSLKMVPGKFSESAQLTVKAASDALGITPRQVRIILESGVLSDLDSEKVMRLASKSIFVPHKGNQPVLRTGSSGTDPEDGRPIGYSNSMTDAEVVEANRMWWRADPNKIISAGYLPISVGSLIVALLRIEGLDESVRFEAPDKNGNPGKEVRHSFKATLVARYDADSDTTVMKTGDTDDTVVALTLLGHFHRAVSGGPIAYL